jgi:hypothetical protein
MESLADGVAETCPIPDISPAISPVHGKIGSEGRSGWGATMLIHLHSQATTPPKIRAAILASTEPAPALAERFGITA